MRIRNRVSMGLLLAMVASLMALSVPASADEPAEIFFCGWVEVERVNEEVSRSLPPGTEELQLVHATATYTVAGESLPFFRFVSSWIERLVYDEDLGVFLSIRSGLDEGFIGRTIFWTDAEGDHVIAHGREIEQPNDLACEALTR